MRQSEAQLQVADYYGYEPVYRSQELQHTRPGQGVRACAFQPVLYRGDLSTYARQTECDLPYAQTPFEQTPPREAVLSSTGVQLSALPWLCFTKRPPLTRTGWTESVRRWPRAYA